MRSCCFKIPIFLVHRNALAHPNNVANLLLLELNERVENTKTKLRVERVFVEIHFVLEKRVFERLVRIVCGRSKNASVLKVNIDNSTNLD